MRFAVLWLAALSSAAAQTPCEKLASLELEHTTITAAEMKSSYCRVAAVLAPTSDSHIEMEVWLPLQWNGKFEAVGNGGWAGSIGTAAMAAAITEGYATASTDTGHKSSETPGGSFALGHPEKLIDYGYRAVHLMTVTAKKVIEAHYGRAPSLSYWNSCSNGGRQGLMEAQRYPADFDGIVAGAPAANWTGRAIGALWVAQLSHKTEASYIPPAKYPLLHEAALKACDALDGVTDGLIENPRACRFDPGVLEDSLAAAQIETARGIYAATPFFPGLSPGSELGWATYGGQRPFAIGNDYGRFVLNRDAGWDYRTMDAAAAAKEAARIDQGTTNALNPDLRAFFARGGKLLQYHGWSDPQIPPMHSVNYYESVLEKLGNVSESYRLFMAPGMAHCGGGTGPNQFAAMASMERWRENGVAPQSLLAARVVNNKVERTRPLCPYPQTAHYTGTGSINDASNFVCK